MMTKEMQWNLIRLQCWAASQQSQATEEAQTEKFAQILLEETQAVGTDAAGMKKLADVILRQCPDVAEYYVRKNKERKEAAIGLLARGAVGLAKGLGKPLLQAGVNLAKPPLRAGAALAKPLLWAGKGLGRLAWNRPKTTAALGAGGLALGTTIASTSNMTPGVQTNWNPLSSNFRGYNTQGFARLGSPVVGTGNVYQQHKGTDQKIDVRNSLLWDRNPDPNTNVPVNRGSTVARNGQPIDIAGITPEQRRTVVDTFDAIHRQGEHEGRKLPAVRGPGWLETLGLSGGHYNHLLNSVYMKPITGDRGTKRLPAHEIAHWQRQKEWGKQPLPNWLWGAVAYPFYGASHHSEEFNTDAETYRTNQLVHPDSRIRDGGRILDALSRGRGLSGQIDKDIEIVDAIASNYRETIRNYRSGSQPPEQLLRDREQLLRDREESLLRREKYRLADTDWYGPD